MSALHQLYRRIRGWFRRGQLERDMAEEMRFHLSQRTADQIADGLAPEEARYAAQRRFGGIEQIKERAREERSFVVLEQFAQDFIHGLRALRRDLRFTIIAVATLALGIGANTAMFSVFDAVLLHPLPYSEAERLVAVWERNPATGEHNPVSSGNYLDWREQNPAFEEIGAFAPMEATLLGDTIPQTLTGMRITPSMLALLRVQPMLGRGFIAGDKAEADSREILISYALWQTRFGGRGDILGTCVHLDDAPVTIVGVMPPAFEFPARNSDFWLPLRFDASDRESRRVHQWRVLGRLRPGMDRVSAQAAMNVVASRISRAHPESMAGWGVDVESYHSDLVAHIEPTLVLMGGMVALVLLVACANVANLMLARAIKRQRELAIRSALGAGRGRIVRQLLTESILLAALGAAVGLILATWTMPFLSALVPAELPGSVPLGLNLAAMEVALVSLLIALLIIGLAPAWWLSRIDLASFLHGGRTNTGGTGLRRTRNTLLVAQLALATMLLVGAGLLVRSLAKLNQVDFGFEPKHLLSATVDLPRSRYATIAAQAAFYERLREKLATIPGVEGVAGISDPPLTNSSTFSFVIAGRPRPGPNPREDPVEVRAVSPSYFGTVRVPVLEGRTFVVSDAEGSPGVAIVNQAFAKRHFPAGNAVGQRISSQGQGGPWIEIVGVVGGIRDQGLEQAAAPAIYRPYVQKEFLNLSALTAIVRVSADLDSVREQVRRIFQTLDPELSVRRLATLPELYAGRLARRNFVTRLTAAFAVLTLVLGVIGVYGLFSFSVAQRRREFGICLALGAAKRDIVIRVARDGVKLIGLAVLAGAAGAVLLAHYLGALLFEVQPLDPLTLVAVITGLGSVSVAALWFPARKAARTDPMIALSVE